MGNLAHASDNAPNSRHPLSAEGTSPILRPPSETDQLHADLQRTLFDFVEFKLKACSTYAGDVDTNLAAGNGPGARQAFRRAEEAFESVQRCVLRIEREDWRVQTDAVLKDLGLKIDGLWVKLISGGFAVL